MDLACRPRTGLVRSGKSHSLSPARVSWQQRQRQRQQQQWQRQRRLPAPPAARFSGDGGSGRRDPRGGRQPSPQLDPTRLLQQYGLPALGLLVAGSLIGPLVGGIVFTALGMGVAVAAGAAALSFSWVAVPIILAVFGLPALMAGGLAAGVFATMAGGALLFKSLVQLVLVGGGLWLGATLAQQVFFGGARGGISPDGTIDVEAEPVKDDWREEIFKEQRERDAELKEFDDLLRRREDFKNRGRY